MDPPFGGCVLETLPQRPGLAGAWTRLPDSPFRKRAPAHPATGETGQRASALYRASVTRSFRSAPHSSEFLFEHIERPVDQLPVGLRAHVAEAEHGAGHRAIAAADHETRRAQPPVELG